jgi:hypothetical protein
MILPEAILAASSPHGICQFSPRHLALADSYIRKTCPFQAVLVPMNNFESKKTSSYVHYNYYHEQYQLSKFIIGKS